MREGAWARPRAGPALTRPDPLVSFLDQTTMDTPTTGPIRVVLKRMKPAVVNAAAFFDAEHLLNVYAARKARDGVASFFGFVDVPPKSAGRQLTAGTWLVWRFEGGRTLAEFLRRRDCDGALAEALGLPDRPPPGVLAATVLADVLASLAGLHAAGVVHRDVKPANLIVGDSPPGGWPQVSPSSSRARRRPPAPGPRLLLIDLGAAADLRYGTNFDPAESVLDPLYCPPERFVLPSAEAPALTAANGLLSSVVLSPLVWARWRPDAFDAYSAGLVLMQAALPRLRPPAGLRAFNSALARVGGDLEAWKASAKLSVAESAALDAEGGAGWALATALLAPRAGLASTPDGGVAFDEARGSAGARPTAASALRHRFITRLAVPVRSRKPVEGPADEDPPAALVSSVRRGASSQPAPAPPSAAPSAVGLLTGTAAAVWRAATQRLFALEGRLLAQSEAVATQTTRVRVAVAQAAAAAGSADTAAVARAAVAAEESSLAAEQAKLDGLASDFEAAAAGASERLAGLLPEADGQPTTTPVAAALTAAAVGGLAGALRWTGTALRVATALAIQVADGASRAAEEEAERAAALDVDREAGLAFLEALRGLVPPVAPGDAWEADVRPRLVRDKRVTRVPPAAAAALYAAYAAARDRAAAARAADAERGFAAALADAAIPVTVPWADASLVLGGDPATQAAFAAGLDPAALYTGLQAAAAAEVAFNGLLSETIHTTKRGAPWRALRPSICYDPRFQPIDEMRRREIYVAARAVYDAAAAAAEAAEAEVAAEAEAVPPPPPPPVAKAVVVDGAALAQEQKRLRAEYEKMEAKLKVMEAALAAASAKSGSPVPGGDGRT